jgi:hypothetical protein
MSKLELVDAASDGAAWTAVQIMEGTNQKFTPRLVYAWTQGGWASQQMAAGIDALGFPGCVALSLGGALLSQWAAASTSIDRRARANASFDSQHGVRAEMAGLGAVAEAITPKGETQDGKSLTLHAARVLGEGLPQLVWQGSGLMASGEALSKSPVLAGSLALTLGTTIKKGIDLIKIWKNSVHGWTHRAPPFASGPSSSFSAPGSQCGL